MVSSPPNRRSNDASVPRCTTVPSILNQIRRKLLVLPLNRLRRASGHLTTVTPGHRGQRRPSPWVESLPFVSNHTRDLRSQGQSTPDRQPLRVRTSHVSTPGCEGTDPRLQAPNVTVDTEGPVFQCRGRLRGISFPRSPLDLVLCTRIPGGGRSGTCVSSR